MNLGDQFRAIFRELRPDRLLVAPLLRDLRNLHRPIDVGRGAPVCRLRGEPWPCDDWLNLDRQLAEIER